MKSFWIAAAAGFVLGFIGAGAVLAFKVSTGRAAVRVGWNLKPVVVAAVDMTEGTEIAFDQISQRSLPEQFVTASDVLPDDAHQIIGKKVNAPVQAGDPINRQLFLDLSKYQRAQECAKAIAPAVLAAGDAAREVAIAEYVKDLPKLPAPDKLSAPPGDVVLAAQDIAEGTLLTAAMLKAAPMTPELLTASMVPAELLPKLVGARAVVPLQKGDAVLWQLLDSGKRQRSPIGCELAVANVARAAREKAAAEEAAKELSR